MTTRRTFRFLIAISWLMPLAATLVEGIFYSPRYKRAAFNPTTGFIPHSSSWGQLLVVTFTLSLFIGAIVVSAGLWSFRRWARFVYLPFSAFYVWWWPYGMPQPHLPIALADFATFITFGAQGAAAAMSFLPPLAALFARKGPNQAMQPTAGRRTAELSMTPSSSPAATRVPASGG